MDKEDYLNKEEYQYVEGMNSYDENQPENSGEHEYRDAQDMVDPRQEYAKGIFEGEGEEDDEEPEGEIRHAGLKTEFIEEESKHVMMYVLEGYEPEHAVVSVDDESMDDKLRDYANSPIQENEDEQYSTPQDQAYIEELDERIRLFQLADEVKKKDQGRKFVLWELNQLRNEWQDKEYHHKSKAISQKKLEHHWNNDIARARNSPRSKANAFDYSNIEEQNLPVHKPKRWMEGVESRIPMLADHENAMKRKVGRKVDIEEFFQNRSRFNYKINNSFIQNEHQKGLAPKNPDLSKSHTNIHNIDKTANTKKEIFAGRPIFGYQTGNHMHNISNGRNRMFHTSNVF